MGISDNIPSEVVVRQRKLQTKGRKRYQRTQVMAYVDDLVVIKATIDNLRNSFELLEQKLILS